MANTTTETLTVNGVVLNTYAKNIESLTGRLGAPPRLDRSKSLPGRNGSVPPTRVVYGPNQINLPMWVAGCDDDGNIPVGGARDAFFDNLDVLIRLFNPDSGLLDIRQTLPDGSVRQCFAELLDTINFAHESNSDPFGHFSVVLRVPASFWQDVAAVTYSITNPGNSASLPLTPFVGATAVMDDLVYEFTGPCTNPMVANGDRFVRYNAALTAGQVLTIDCSTWTLTATGFTPDYSKLDYGVSIRWMELSPTATPTLAWTASGTSSATKVRVIGKRKFLVA